MVFTCHFCDKKFEYKSYLDRHQKKHDNFVLRTFHEETVNAKDQEIEKILEENEQLKIQVKNLEANRNSHYQLVHRLREKIAKFEEIQTKQTLNYNTFNIYTSCDVDKFKEIINTLHLEPARVNIYQNFVEFHYIHEDNVPIETLTYIHNLLFDERFEDNFTASFIIKKICMYIFDNLYKNQFSSIKLFNKKYRFVLLFYDGNWKTHKFTEIRNKLYNNSFKKIVFFCLDHIKHNTHYSDKLVKTIKKEWNEFHLADLNNKLQTKISEISKNLN